MKENNSNNAEDLTTLVSSETINDNVDNNGANIMDIKLLTADSNVGSNTNVDGNIDKNSDAEDKNHTDFKNKETVESLPNTSRKIFHSETMKENTGNGKEYQSSTNQDICLSKTDSNSDTLSKKDQVNNVDTNIINVCSSKDKEANTNPYETNNSAKEDEREFVDIDEFLQRSGECGKYQFLIVIEMMLLTLPLAYPVFIFYFISFDPNWVNKSNATFHNKDDNSRCTMNRSEWLYDYEKTTLTTEFDLVCDKSWLLSLSGSVVFIGWAIGSFVLGFFSDIYGRKYVMIPCLFMDLFCLFLHAFVSSIWTVITIRFIMGFFHAAPALNAYILLVEMIGPNYRVLAANVAGLVWGIATSLLALKAYLIDDWRTLCFAASAPYFILLFLGLWFPESIRWLNSNGRTEEAEEILHKAAAINKRPLKNVSIKKVNNKENEHRVSYIDLFNSMKVLKITLSQGYIWLNNGMVYYTMSWAFADLGGDMYINFVLAALVELPMHAVAIICLESFGRKITTWASLLVTFISCVIVVLLISCNHFGVFKLIFGLIGKSAISLAFMCTYMWSSEIYPTVVRTQGLGFNIITSRTGAAISPFTNNLDLVHPALPFLVMAVSTVVAFLLCFMLPETLGKPTRETFQDLFEEE